jgi:COP9 signalosome complex subunit 6
MLLVESHLQTQRAALKMLHERILLLVKYVADVIAGHRGVPSTTLDIEDFLGQAKRDHSALRSLSALVASLPATENPGFREEFETVCDYLLARV